MTEAGDRTPLIPSLGRDGEERARERAEARERRSSERAQLAQERTDRRTEQREQASREREERRGARLSGLTMEAPLRSASDDAEPAPKRRASGSLRRTGEIRVERDTRHFKTVVDAGRIRELARRGAKVDGLAAVFKMSVEAIEAVLAEGERTG